jgi:hypothetical protein
MEYTYTIRRVEPKQKLLAVVYHVEGRDDYFKNFATDDFTAAAVTTLIERHAPQMRAYWQAYDDAPDTAEVVDGETGGGSAELVVYEVAPEYDPLTENLVRYESLDPVTLVRTVGYTVETATQAEISQRKAQRTTELQSDPVILQRAQALVTLKTIDPTTLSDEEFADIAVLYPPWTPDANYAVDDLTYYDGRVWRCVQAHTAQADWAPEFVPALFSPYRNPASGPDPWVQPTGAQDAYSIGEQVTHDNPNDGGAIWVYESAIDANTTEPGRDGTFDRWWTPIARA